VFEVRREVAQTRVRHEVAQTRVWSKMRSWSNPRKTRSYSDPRLKSAFPFGRDVRILVETRPSCWSVVCVWWLSIITFKQPTRTLQMEADIFAWQSQQSSTVIWKVTRESQHTNHTVMEICMTRTISYDSQDIYTLRTRRKGDSIQTNWAQEDCKPKIAL